MILRYKYIYLISCQSCWQSPPPLSINLWVSDTCHLQDAEINESSPRPIEKKWHQGTEGQTGHPVGNGGNNVPTSRVWRAATSCLLDFLVTSHSKSLTRIKWRFSYFRSISLYRWPRPQDTPPPLLQRLHLLAQLEPGLTSASLPGPADFSTYLLTPQFPLLLPHLWLHFNFICGASTPDVHNVSPTDDPWPSNALFSLTCMAVASVRWPWLL